MSGPSPRPGNWSTVDYARMHYALRMNEMDLVRTTEQTAIFMSLVQSLRTKRGAPMLRRLGLEAHLGYLGYLHVQGRFVCWDKSDVGNAERRRIWRDLMGDEEPSNGRFGYAPPDQGWGLDFAASPIDGLTDFAHSRDSGAVSAVCAGEPNAFVALSEPFGEPDHYLVITANPSLPRATGLVKILEKQGIIRRTTAGGITGPAFRVNDTNPLAVDAFFENLLARLDPWIRGLGRPWSTATLTQPDSQTVLRPVLLRHSRTRVVGGSSVAAALATFLPTLGLDTFVGLVRPVHVLLLAVAARATGGLLLAFATDRAAGAPRKPTIPSGAAVYTKDDLVRKPDVVLAATGITENLVVEGVRFKGKKVTTHTVVVRGRTQGVHFIHHQHDLARKTFRFAHEQSGDLNEAIDEIEDQICGSKRTLGRTQLPPRGTPLEP